MTSQAVYDQDAVVRDPRWDLRLAQPAPLDPPDPAMSRRAKWLAVSMIVAWLAVGAVLACSGHFRVTDEPQRPTDAPTAQRR